ncbi:hypothetical protein R1flu_025560 [Riccia fluitans]|uniref:GRAM domain-containing protein n=1 Tax=Riccia fluitans TaxID=41844 RepID=A0ABD1XY37_9MARC
MDNSNPTYPPPQTASPYNQPQQPTSDYAPYPPVNHAESGGVRQWGSPVMGVPANPSSHPDNQQAAAGGGLQSFPGSSSTGSLFRQPSGSEAKPSQTQAVPPNPGYAPAGGQAPQRPYVHPSATGQKGTMDKLVEQVNQFGKKFEEVAGNVWGHLSTNPSIADAALGRLSAGTKILTEGGFDNVFRSTFPVDSDEVLKKTYACYLSTSTGPVAGTLYVSSKKFAFCSDRPLSYKPAPGQQAYSYYKVVVPLDRVRDVTPSVNESRPAEKYIQVNTVDNYEFWFMGFVNYDKGVTNMQGAVRDRGAAPSANTTGNTYQQPPASTPGNPPPPQYH